jgi:hypothetical protein
MRLAIGCSASNGTLLPPAAAAQSVCLGTCHCVTTSSAAVLPFVGERQLVNGVVQSCGGDRPWASASTDQERH